LQRVAAIVTGFVVMLVLAACGGGTVSGTLSGNTTGSTARSSAGQSATSGGSSQSAAEQNCGPLREPDGKSPLTSNSRIDVPPGTVQEYVCTGGDLHGSRVYGSNDFSAPPNGVPGVIPKGTVIFVRCHAPNTSGGYKGIAETYSLDGGPWSGMHIDAAQAWNGGMGVNLNPAVKPC
jgi:hypothetical protein